MKLKPVHIVVGIAVLFLLPTIARAVGAVVSIAMSLMVMVFWLVIIGLSVGLCYVVYTTFIAPKSAR
jgi:hypothetical protein